MVLLLAVVGVWTNVAGRAITAEPVRIKGASVVLKTGAESERTLPVFNRLVHRASAGGKVRFALDGISVVKYLNDIYQYKSGNTVYTPFAAHDYRTYKVAFVLCGTNDDRTAGPWTALGDAQATPVFEVSPEALVYRFYRIEARITAP